ncbi:hypothetical protein T02_580 [Trichinella nativa]|uniref:Uncharacterized protein n=3 Tax=Trichinella TaxID=6333 RepID=A0A0V1LNK1_9BILA|nr:hypothetical protein T05_7442 [Trichinella murrelli]KRX68580.1 hypothetical protein T09_5401 [Trichinella sp. T9]KRY57216.1 hypothetical protein T03_4233 [Trichinella britovi]KRZ60940.1 hypothetical protein T02_580 [Trichinella nativa]
MINIDGFLSVTDNVDVTWWCPCEKMPFFQLGQNILVMVTKKKTQIYLDGKDVGGGCVNGRGERRKKKNSFTGHESSSPPMTLTVAFHGNGYIIALPD